MADEIAGLVERLRAPGGKFSALCHEAADALESLQTDFNQLYDRNKRDIAALRAEIRTLEREISELDDVIHVLGVEDSEVTPAERAREWLAEIEAERKIIARLQEALERVIKESENPTSLEFLYALNDARDWLAGEVKALRAENERFKGQGVRATRLWQDAQAEIARLKELYSEQVQRADKYFIDSQRLRAALERIANLAIAHNWQTCQEIARSALAGEDKDG